jgi:hypothetical protein
VFHSPDMNAPISLETNRRLISFVHYVITYLMPSLYPIFALLLLYIPLFWYVVSIY